MVIISEKLTETITIENLKLTLEWNVKGQNLLSIGLFAIILPKEKWIVIIKEKYTVTMMVNIDFFSFL